MEYGNRTVRLRYDLGKWFEQAWTVFKAHIWEFILLALVLAVPALIIGGIAGGFSAYDAIQHPNRNAQPFPLVPSPMQVILVAVSALFGAAISTPLVVGIAAVALNVIRTGVFDWDRLWTGFRKWPDAFVIGLISGGLNVLPSLFPLLWILFPLWIAVGFWAVLAAYRLSEPGTSCRDAMSMGIRLISGNFWWAVLFAFIAAAVSGLGMIACCIGILASAAFYQVLLAIAYNDLSWQITPAPGVDGSDQGAV